jgi:hypothetical protein
VAFAELLFSFWKIFNKKDLNRLMKVGSSTLNLTTGALGYTGIYIPGLNQSTVGAKGVR